MQFRILIILIFLSFFVSTTKAQERYTVDSGFISFFSSAPFEDIYAENNQIKSLIDLTTGEIAFVVPIRGFKFKKSLMESHFNKKYLESDKFPNAIFTGKFTTNAPLDKEILNKVLVEGVLQIHGVSLKINEQGTISFHNEDVAVLSEFKLRPKEFKIKIPRILIKNIAEEVLVKVNLIYQSTN